MHTLAESAIILLINMLSMLDSAPATEKTTKRSHKTHSIGEKIEIIAIAAYLLATVIACTRASVFVKDIHTSLINYIRKFHVSRKGLVPLYSD